MKQKVSSALYHYNLYLADSTFVLSHRLSEWCGHGPYLEEDLALSNISLDLLGQSRYFYEYAAKLSGTDENSLIFMREEREYRNLLLTELVNGDYAQTIFQLYCFALLYAELLKELSSSKDDALKGMSQKFLLEVNNHIDHSKHWLRIFLKSTQESKERLDKAVDFVSPYLLEAFTPSAYEEILVSEGIAANMKTLQSVFVRYLAELFDNTDIVMPSIETMKAQQGGKEGEHTEYMGYLLAEVQYVNNKLPNLIW